MAEAAANSPELDAAIAETQKLLGAVIKKPPLAAKHLAKPPFRFLFDIVSETIRSAGFAPGLFDDQEMNPENVKEKDAKIAYLTKLVTCLSFTSKTAIDAKPAKIIAGLEPEKTNALLQVLGQVIQNKVDTKDAVKRTLAGEQFSAKPAQAAKAAAPSKAAPAKAPEKPKEAAAAPQSKPSAPVAAPGSAKPEQQPKPDSAPKKEGTPATPAAQAKPAEKKPEEKPKERPKEEPKIEDKKKPEEIKEKPKEKVPPPTDKPAVAQQQAPSSVEKKPEAPKDDKKVSPPKEKISPKKSETDLVEPDPVLGSTGDVNLDEDQGAASGFVPRRPGRPTSARPAPPRPKKAEAQPELVRAEAPVVITDSAHQDDAEDELVFVDPHELSKTLEVDDGKHGGLVRKILETKREFEGEDKKQSVVADILPKKDEKATTQEIEQLRQCIQSLTRAANPLGKTMDYVQEDLDSMTKELEFWKKESQKYNRQLEEEQRSTEESLLPLENQLRQIESSILDQLERISASKANILQHELTIQKLLSNVTNAAR